MTSFTQIQQHQKFEKIENRFLMKVKMTLFSEGECQENAQAFFKSTLWNLISSID